MSGELPIKLFMTEGRVEDVAGHDHCCFCHGGCFPRCVDGHAEEQIQEKLMHEGGRFCAHWMFVCRQVSIGVHGSVSRSNELRETVRRAGSIAPQANTP
jgi:hypothetical protein